jgi:hypothetical protein
MKATLVWSHSGLVLACRVTPRLLGWGLPVTLLVLQILEHITISCAASQLQKNYDSVFAYTCHACIQYVMLLWCRSQVLHCCPPLPAGSRAHPAAPGA